MATLYVDFVNGENKTYTGTITGATKAAQCVLTITSHIFTVGDVISVASVAGMTQLNGFSFNIVATATNTVTIDVNSTGYGTYTSGGTATAFRKTITGITQANPAVVTCPNHAFTNGQLIYINEVVGMTEVNNGVFTVANAAANTFELTGIDSSAYTAYASAGRAARPFLTFLEADLRATAGDSIRIAKTTAATNIAISNSTWTSGLNTVSTVSTHVGSISVGDYVGTGTAAGNGADETYYKVTGVSATTITLEGYYGSTTKTVASINKIVPLAVGPSPGACIVTTKALSVSGGWDLVASPTQNGETWLRPTGVRTVTTNYCINVGTIGSTFDRINGAEAYYVFYTGYSVNVTNCSFIAGYVYTAVLSGVGWNLDSCRISSNGGASWAAASITTQGTLTNSFVSAYAAIQAVGLAISGALSINLTSVTLKGCGYGVSLGAATDITGGNFSYCNYGVYVNLFGTSIISPTIANCASGIYLSGITQGHLIRGANISQCSVAAINIVQAQCIKIETSTFVSNLYDIKADSYCGAIYSVGNSHTTPGTRAYDRLGACGPIYIINCTIDAPSIAKTFAQTSTDNYIAPQFYLQESFGLTGAYYGKLEISKNTSYSPPAVQLKMNTGVTANKTEFKVASLYAKASVARTLGFKLRAAAPGWSGTIIPKIQLNGVTIQTETTISSVSDVSDTTYSYVVSSGTITADGELSIGFLANCNTIAVIVKEFTVT